MNDVQAAIESLLREALDPIHLIIIDESAKHSGHREARGGGHFQVTIVSECFEGRNLLERHRLIYALLREEMGGTIHALKLKTWTPQEWAARGKQTEPSA